ncbi:chorismate lyase [Dechloromonas sp. HYN0024]|uniref:chorismate--pyruvate lyase family protein n=1 Tax=Dechloromonas sp. HYN0024 TaxID=2231055 RepID=UPI000E446D85|nr:chorismate lyase [Dechloromonas sp. HYN0024]AXS79248.1 chorismate lyase [Dechloromonas sp. HYN0024]
MKQNKWRSCLSGGAIDAALASWLREPGSLTARCQRHCRQFRVRLLRYEKGWPLADEGLSMNLSRQPAWIREVVLTCDGVPVIFAHTTLATAGRGRLSRWLARLGSQSLGSLLFSHPGFHRGAIEFRRLDRRHPLYQRAAVLGAVSDTLWARRSLHRLCGQQVLVTEVFLPAVKSLGI